MTTPVIASIARTPVGKFNGTLKRITAPNLGAIAIKEALKRASVEDDDRIDEVIMGNVISAGIGQAPARQAAIYAGLPYTLPAFTLNKVCGSGLKTVMLAASLIKAGEADIIVAGGMENMNLAPYYLRKARNGYRLGDGKLVDGMIFDGLWDIYNDFHMGHTGEVVAEEFDISREDADRFALRSHQLAAKAMAEGKFDEEIVPVPVPQRRGDPIPFLVDEGVRTDTSIEALSRLRAVFKKDGIVTAGNASQISDGAAAAVVMSDRAAEEVGVEPLARIHSYHTAGVEPRRVMAAPIPLIYQLLEKSGFERDDIDLWEHNEAFASASVAIQREFDIPDEKFNVHGGAVAIGHPIGCSGARVLATLLYAMRDRDATRGLEAVCLGGGHAVGMIVERL